MMWESFRNLMILLLIVAAAAVVLWYVFRHGIHGGHIVYIPRVRR